MLRTTELSFWLIPLGLYATEPRCSDTFNDLLVTGALEGTLWKTVLGRWLWAWLDRKERGLTIFFMRMSLDKTPLIRPCLSAPDRATLKTKA